jgi:hypothetical protein
MLGVAQLILQAMNSFVEVDTGLLVVLLSAAAIHSLLAIKAV